MYIHILIFIDLKAFFIALIFLVFFTSSPVTLYSQDFELQISTKDSVHNSVLKKIPYNILHKEPETIFKEADIISKKLALSGYINNTYTINKKNTLYKCIYTLNKKIDSIRIYYSNTLLDESILNKITTKSTNTYFEISTSAIDASLNNIVAYFETKGASFTNASLQNLSQQGNILSAQLQLNISEKRKINTIVIKGYTDFPKKQLKHYLNLKKHSIFNINSLKSINEQINAIPFVTQQKEPAVLFTKDSTTLFLYLKKKATSKFDGVIGFSNNENSNKLTFNGYLDLTLNNILNKGESFGLNWKNNGGDTQTLTIGFETPFIFNTKFSTSGDFSIFKQDSTYVNTKTQLKVKYHLNSTNFINGLISTKSSNIISTQNTLSSIDEFKNTFIGLSYTYYKPSNSQYNNSSKLFLNAGYQLGTKTMLQIKSNQAKVQLSAAYNFNLNSKNTILLKSTNEYLNASNLLQNELFRIGGSSIMRGFDEQSIATSKYSVNTIEYHYNVSQGTQIYTITDVAFILDDFTSTEKQLYGIGLGYFFNTNNRIINLSYVTGKTNQSTFNLNNSKLHIKITYLF